MNNRPGDMSDLCLSPVAIELDQRLEALAGQSPPEELEQYVQLRTDRHPENQLVLGVPEAVLGYLAI